MNEDRVLSNSILSAVILSLIQGCYMREMRQIYVLSLDQLTKNVAGLIRLCKWLGIKVDTDPYHIACLYLRWCKRNPQPKIDKR